MHLFTASTPPKQRKTPPFHSISGFRLPVLLFSGYSHRVKKPLVPQPAAPPSLGLRRYLYFTAAVTGAAIMIVEILGAKMLAPYVGTSHFVWTAQIAITLVALAAGYYVGGRVVDRSQDLKRLYWAIVWAAVYLCFAVLVIEPIAYWCLRFRLALGTLIASAFLFLVPLALLAMAGPFIVRVLSSSVAGVGGNMGRLTAISTLGSVVGTALIGYLLIPLFHNSITMYGTAGLLILIAVIYFTRWRRTSLLPAAATACLALLLGGWATRSDLRGTHFSRMTELARDNSEFGLLQVLEDKAARRRYYLNDYLTQNTYDTEQKKSVSMFTYMLHGLSHAYTPSISNVLCIGLGIGIVPMEFAREGAQVDVVEINPDVVPLAAKYFDFEPARLNIIYGDGRYYLNQCKKQYDTINLDAFLGDSSPSHLMSREAFAAMKRALAPHGTLVINTFADLDAGRDFFAASLSKTLAAVFRSVRIHSGGEGNTMFVASDQPDLKPLRAFDFSRVHVSQFHNVQNAYAGIRETDPARGIVLTDDFNPVEFHDAQNREDLRKRLVQSMRNL
jgi:spermidine synthase